jgi:hypothetical protein
MAQAVEHLLNKCEALNKTTTTTTKNQTSVKPWVQAPAPPKKKKNKTKNKKAMYHLLICQISKTKKKMCVGEDVGYSLLLFTISRSVFQK